MITLKLTYDELELMYDVLGRCTIGTGPSRFHRRAQLVSALRNKVGCHVPVDDEREPGIEGHLHFVIPEDDYAAMVAWYTEHRPGESVPPR